MLTDPYTVLNTKAVCVLVLFYWDVTFHMFYRYDGDSYVRNVEANFVLWEMKGRTDYGYTSLMKEVSHLLRM